MSSVNPYVVAAWPYASGTQISAEKNEEGVSFVLRDRNLLPRMVFKTVLGWISPEILAENVDAVAFYKRLKPLLIQHSILIFSLVDNEYISDAKPPIRLLICIEQQHPTLRILSQKHVYSIPSENITGLDCALFYPLEGSINRTFLDRFDGLQILQLSEVDLKRRTVAFKCKSTLPSKKATKTDWHSLLGLITPRTYFENRDPTLFRTLTIRMQIFVKTLTTKTIVIEVAPTDTIAEVKRKVEEKTGVSFNEYLELKYGSIPFRDDDKTLADYNIVKESTIHINKRNVGGGVPPLNFPNVSENQMKSVGVEYGKRDWRLIKPGLNLIGFCFNPNCITQQCEDKLASIPKQFGKFDMRILSSEAHCPGCNQLLQKINCCFIKCLFSVEAMTEKMYQMLLNKKRAPDDHLLMFNDEESSRINYEYLKITTEEISRESSCILQ